MKEFFKALHWLSLAAGFGVMLYCAFTAHSVFDIIILLLYLSAWIATWYIMAGEDESMQRVQKEVYGTWVYGVHIILSVLACPWIVMTLCTNIINYNSINGGDKSISDVPIHLLKLYGRSFDEVLLYTAREILNGGRWWYMLMLIVFSVLIIRYLRKK